MLTNLHTHTTFCDGDHTPEEIVLAALEAGFVSVGFSGHGYTSFDQSYCMQDTDGYVETVRALQRKYADQIDIYLGIEEDAFEPVDRTQFDYIIGSSHYFMKDGTYYAIDSDYNGFSTCLQVFDQDVLQMAEVYYNNFSRYIYERKPDIVGHFDLLTKFDESEEAPRFLQNDTYFEIAEKYLKQALQNDVIFEVNTGAISRGYRSSPYPHERLLHTIFKQGGKITLTSDCHVANALACHFDETKAMLREIGFDGFYVFRRDHFEKVALR